jgi:DNA polymerase I
MSLYGGITLPNQPDLENVRRLDLMVLPQLNRMSRYGIAIDRPYLAELGSQFASEMSDLSRDIASYIPPHALDRFSESAAAIEENEGLATINASSAQQIRSLVFDLLAVGRDKKLKTTGAGMVSTGRKNLDMCRDDHPVVPLVIQYRERAKLKSAFCDALPKQAQLHPAGKSCPVCELSHVETTWRSHTTFNTTRAITGRLSSSRVNLQQIPIRTDLGARIRAAFVASTGTKLVSVDFSQMEIRDLAHLADARSMIRIYEADGDIHLNTAMKAFGIADPAIVDKYKHRLPSKRTNFGIQNGTTETGLEAQLVGDYWAAGITPDRWPWDASARDAGKHWCRQFIEDWHAIYPEVQPYFETRYYLARRYGFVWDPWGRTRYIPQVRSSLPYKVHEGLREAQNFAVTASNAEQTKLAMAECEELFTTLLAAGVWVWPLLSIHDQIIAEVEEYWAGHVGGDIVRIFEHVMDDRETGERLWRCPIKSDCEILDRWKSKE